MGVLVKYKNNAIMTYSLNAYALGGYRVAFNGSKGRIQVSVENCIYKFRWTTKSGVLYSIKLQYFLCLVNHMKCLLKLQKEAMEVVLNLLNDLFGVPEPDKFNRAASHTDGAMSILTGLLPINLLLPVCL